MLAAQRVAEHVGDPKGATCNGSSEESCSS